MDIAAILTENRADIIGEWMVRMRRDISAKYSVQPLEELYQTVSAAFDANYQMLVEGDYTELDQVIEWIGRLRSRNGFVLSEVQKAFEIYRMLVLPILFDQLDGEPVLGAVERVNILLAYTIHRFSEYFQALHQEKIWEYSQNLETKVHERTKQLAESENKYRTLVEEIRDGYFVIQEGKVSFANREFCAMHGYHLDDVMGRPFTFFVAPESLADIRQVYEDRITEKDTKEQYVYFRRHRDGSARPTENRVTLTSYQGKVVAIGICRDITERVAIEKRVREAESMARLGHLSTSLAHEIRNPLSSAKMSLQMILKNASYESKDKRRLEILAQQITRIERIMTEMLDLARPIKFEFASVALHEAIDHSLDALEAKIQEKSIRVNKYYDDIRSLCLDGETMEQAIINLLLNAVEAVEDGGRIDIFIEDQPPESVRIRIVDNGCGVNLEDLPYIFDPFFSRKAKGTGLGLANVKRIIEAHQGTITAESPRAGGMSITVVLKAGRGEDQDNAR